MDGLELTKCDPDHTLSREMVTYSSGGFAGIFNWKNYGLNKPSDGDLIPSGTEGGIPRWQCGNLSYSMIQCPDGVTTPTEDCTYIGKKCPTGYTCQAASPINSVKSDTNPNPQPLRGSPTGAELTWDAKSVFCCPPKTPVQCTPLDPPDAIKGGSDGAMDEITTKTCGDMITPDLSTYANINQAKELCTNPKYMQQIGDWQWVDPTAEEIRLGVPSGSTLDRAHISSDDWLASKCKMTMQGCYNHSVWPYNQQGKPYTTKDWIWQNHDADALSQTQLKQKVCQQCISGSTNPVCKDPSPGSGDKDSVKNKYFELVVGNKTLGFNNTYGPMDYLLWIGGTDGKGQCIAAPDVSSFHNFCVQPAGRDKSMGAGLTQIPGWSWKFRPAAGPDNMPWKPDSGLGSAYQFLKKAGGDDKMQEWNMQARAPNPQIQPQGCLAGIENEDVDTLGRQLQTCCTINTAYCENRGLFKSSHPGAPDASCYEPWWEKGLEMIFGGFLTKWMVKLGFMLWQALPGWAQTGLTAAKDFVGVVVDFLAFFFDPAYAFKHFFTDLANLGYELLKFAGQLWNYFAKMFNGIASFAKAAWKGVKHFFSHFSDKRLKTRREVVVENAGGPGLHLYRFEWTKTATRLYGMRGRDYGFLTCEIKKAGYPHIVKKDEHGYEYIDVEMCKAECDIRYAGDEEMVDPLYFRIFVLYGDKEATQNILDDAITSRSAVASMIEADTKGSPAPAAPATPAPATPEPEPEPAPPTPRPTPVPIVREVQLLQAAECRLSDMGQYRRWWTMPRFGIPVEYQFVCDMFDRRLRNSIDRRPVGDDYLHLLNLYKCYGLGQDRHAKAIDFFDTFLTQERVADEFLELQAELEQFMRVDYTNLLLAVIKHRPEMEALPDIQLAGCSISGGSIQGCDSWCQPMTAPPCPVTQPMGPPKKTQINPSKPKWYDKVGDMVAGLVPKNLAGAIDLGKTIVGMKMTEAIFKKLCRPEGEGEIGILGRMKAAFKWVGKKLMEGLRGLGKLMLKGLDYVTGGRASKLAESVGKTVERWGKNLSEFGKNISEGVSEFGSVVAEKMGFGADGMFTKMSRYLAKKVDKLTEYIAGKEGAEEGVEAGAELGADAAETAGRGLVEALGDMIKALVKKVAESIGLRMTEGALLPPPADAAAMAFQCLTMGLDMWDPGDVNIVFNNSQIANMGKNMTDQWQQNLPPPWPMVKKPSDFISVHPDYAEDSLQRVLWYQFKSPRAMLHQQAWSTCIGMANSEIKANTMQVHKSHLDNCWSLQLASDSKETSIAAPNATAVEPPELAGSPPSETQGKAPVAWQPPDPQPAPLPQSFPDNPAMPSGANVPQPVDSPTPGPSPAAPAAGPPGPPGPPASSKLKLSKKNIIIIACCVGIGVPLLVVIIYFAATKGKAGAAEGVASSAPGGAAVAAAGAPAAGGVRAWRAMA